MFKKITSLILISTMLTFSSTSLAQTAYPSIDSIATIPVPKLELNEPSVGAAISPMKRNQKAPFTGVLFSPEAVSSIIVTYKTFPETIRLEVSNATRICQVQSDKLLSDQKAESEANNSIAQARITTMLSENNSYKKIIDEYQKNNSSSPELWAGIGFVSGVIITTGLVYLATQVSK